MLSENCGMWSNIYFNVSMSAVKAAPWDDINFRFLFCNEVVYPTDHDLIFYWIFRFLIHTFMNPTVNPNKLFVYLNTC